MTAQHIQATAVLNARAAQLQLVASVKFEDVESVYSGKNHKCCCGCAGNHRYNSLYAEAADKSRGYALDVEDVNDKQVRKVLKLNQTNLQDVTLGSNNMSWVDKDASEDGRLYIVYFTDAFMAATADVLKKA